MADITSMIPAGPGLIGQQVADYISQSKTDDTMSSAATSARNAAEVSDKVVQDILKHTIPFGGDVGSMVQNRPAVMLPQPRRPKQMPMGEPGQINATTKAGQRRNDVSSLISSVSNIVKAGVNKKREKEDQALMSDLAIIEAASSQPNDPHNRAILDEIANDPKRAKRLEKALGHNPFSGEPPPPEAQTMAKYSAQSQQKKQAKTQAITQAIVSKLGTQAVGRPGAAMDNLMSRMPNVQQLSPVVALQGELIKAGILPKADTSLNAMKDLIKDMMTNDAKYAEIKARLEASNNASLSRFLSAVETAKAHYETEALRQSGANRRSDETNKSREKIAGMHTDAYKARTKAMEAKLEKQYGAQKAANLIATLQEYDKQISQIQKEIDQVQARKDTKEADKLFQKLHAKQAEADTLRSILKLKDPDVGQTGVDLLNAPDVTPQQMDEEDEDNLFQ